MARLDLEVFLLCVSQDSKQGGIKSVKNSFIDSIASWFTREDIKTTNLAIIERKLDIILMMRLKFKSINLGTIIQKFKISSFGKFGQN